jgi:hypothetical protein
LISAYSALIGVDRGFAFTLGLNIAHTARATHANLLLRDIFLVSPDGTESLTDSFIYFKKMS